MMNSHVLLLSKTQHLAACKPRLNKLTQTFDRKIVVCCQSKGFSGGTAENEPGAHRARPVRPELFLWAFGVQHTFTVKKDAIHMRICIATSPGKTKGCHGNHRFIFDE